MISIKKLDNSETYHDLSSGGKGKSLSFLIKNDISVPNGFVILSNAFEKFISDNNLSQDIALIFKRVRKNRMETIEHASEKIQNLILSKQIPEQLQNSIIKLYKELNLGLVAVRSSATIEDSSDNAWAGQLESYLNTNENMLISNIRKCWASLYTPRAIFYRLQRSLNPILGSVAVVIQEMIQAEVSGVSFSVHPINRNNNELIIEAGYGLGEAIVSNKVTPDSYTVKKDTLEIVDICINTQNRKLVLSDDHISNVWEDVSDEIKNIKKLNDDQIIELSKLIIKIEKIYNCPQDIEWVLHCGKFYITQSRPITTLNF